MKKDVEIWKDIVGYEGSYKVSTMGRVRSLRSGKILKSWKTKGYLQVTLCKDGRRKMFLVHRLVAEAFLKPVAGKDFINHLNEVKTDNRVENLTWVTPKENVNYGTRNERAGKALSKVLTNRKDQSKIVVGIDPDTGKVVVEFPSTREAGRNGYDHSAVGHCCRGEYGHKTYKGLIWRYRQ